MAGMPRFRMARPGRASFSPRGLWTWALAASALPPLAGLLALSALPALFGKDVGAGFSAVERSLCALAPDGSAHILIGGDSRAKQQVMPDVLDSITGLKAVNVAESATFGGDLPTLANVLRKYPRVLESGPVLVLSVSVPGLDDLDFAALSASAVLNWTARDHLRAAGRKPREYFRYLRGWYLPFLKRHLLHRIRKDDFACEEGFRLAPALMASRGFRPDTQRLPPPGPASDSGRRDRRRREDFLLDGGRRRAFARSLEWLARSPAKAILLYNAPMTSEWKADPGHAVDVEMERRLSDLVAAEAARHAKVRFLDFHREHPPELERRHFADNYHLNLEGAPLFSRRIGEYLVREGLVDGKPASAAPPPRKGVSQGAAPETLP